MSRLRPLALFSDVDQVLTLHPINMQFARNLGVEHELATIEEAFYEDGSTDDFNAEFIPLFRGRMFTKKKAEESFSCVALRGKATQLLTIPGVDVYLVSSGPSYYIDLLAQRCSIPHERCECSRYEFDSEGTLSPNVYAVGSEEKAEFVELNAKKYRTTVGIGNSRVLDASFLSQCDVPILLSNKVDKDYLTVSQLGPVVRLVRALTKKSPVLAGV